MAKGVSALVAAVLLIAATMAIAGILAFWASGFIRGKTTEFENTTSVLSKCSSVNFGIYFYNYNNTNATIVLQNKADKELKINEVDYVYPNGTIVPYPVSFTLPGGSIRAIPVLSSVESNYQKFVVLTDCPSVSVEGP